jgi:thiol-disulfide isomerase/thioredoxin
VTVKALAALALVVGVVSAARAQPKAVDAKWALEQRPKQAGVNVSTPAPDQVPQCKVSPIPNPKAPGTSMGYLISDPAGKPVRQFVSYDNKNFNIVSFYLDGVEAYREVYPPQPNEPYQFRWLGPNGTKWGLDHNRDFVIDDWAVISPEEVSQELLSAVIANDPKRLAPLFITKEHLTSIGLPAGDAERILARAAGAAKRLADTSAALKLTDKAKWIHVEFGAPQTRPADSFGGGTTDFTAYKNGTILVEDAGKNPLLQTGELIQVNRAWKIVDGPAAGGAPNTDPDGPKGPLIEPQIKDWVDRLNELDRKGPAESTMAAIAAFNAARAQILENIVAGANAKETWVKMLLDSHAQAAEGGKPGNAHLVRIKQWRDEMAKPTGNPAIAAYAGYRFLVAENSVALAHAKTNEEFTAIQERWRSALEDFVKAFPNASDAPEAVLRLAMAWELSGGKDAAEVKANEAKARQWYDHLTKTFAAHPNAAKAQGALKRLDSEGKPLELTGPLLANPTQQASAAQKDKVVVVYYWASWSGSLAEDAKKFQALLKEYGPKGLTLVTVSLDHDAKAASDGVARSGLPGTHLYASGGLDGSPLGAAYGILAPPHILVAGKDGKITNRSGHTGMLEEELKKLLDK